eukprot:CAMPEP_0198201142 /NCGR_PEP_ID=MMETSP1445-20131203/3927_1 /TAXON_ID=36898 /ORGANISM="Pyramimonas sp., Strain CCMP2087" /LENGTH=339 /DNA_ID=CAMNT_0043871337 /DNA_START=23 /DNA_END=1042 /DNA_ORIENTATION=+
MAKEVRSGLYLGGRTDAEGIRCTSEYTHLLSIGCPLEGGAPDSIIRHLDFPDLLDDVESNILDLLEESVNFIDEALREETRSEGGKVLVHCEAGQSRSAAVVCAWIMAKEGLDFDDALSALKEVAPAVEPNAGFCEQLRMFGSMGCTIDRTRPAYKHFKAQQLALKRQNDGWLDASTLQALPGTTGEGGGQDGEMYRCKKCRCILGSHANQLLHETGRGQEEFKYYKQNKASLYKGPGIECTSYFLEPMLWMEASEITQGHTEGKIQCKCGVRLGTFNWAGEQCSCGKWIVPAFQVAKSRVDTIRVMAPPTISQPRTLRRDFVEVGKKLVPSAEPAVEG